jgi:hypothetical protein
MEAVEGDGHEHEPLQVGAPEPMPPPTNHVRRILSDVASAAKEHGAGILMVLLVAIMWGANPVLTRVVYLSPFPPNPIVIAAVQVTLSAIICELVRFGPEILKRCRQVLTNESETVVDEAGRLPGHREQTGPRQEEQTNQVGPATVAVEARFRSWKDFVHVPLPVPP